MSQKLDFTKRSNRQPKSGLVLAVGGAVGLAFVLIGGLNIV